MSVLLLILSVSQLVQAGTPPKDTPVVPWTQFDLIYVVRQLGGKPPQKIEFYISDDLGSNWRLYGEDADVKSPMRIKVDNDGVYGFYSVGTDYLGRREREPVSGTRPEIYAIVDREAPVARWISPTDSTTSQAIASNRSILLQWESSDNYPADFPVTIFYQVGHSEWRVAQDKLPGTGSIDWRVPNDGSGRINFKLRAVDRAGNEVNLENQTGFTVDTTPPTARVYAPRVAGKESLHIDVEARDNIGGSGVAAAYVWVTTNNGASWHRLPDSLYPNNMRLDFTPTDSGQYGFFAQAIDNAGNLSAAPQPGQIPEAVTHIDTIPPQIEILPDFAGSEGILAAGRRTIITWRGSDENPHETGLSLFYTIDGKESEIWTLITTGKPLTGDYEWIVPAVDAEKSAYIRAIAIDAVGNRGSAYSIPFSISLRPMDTIIYDIVPVPPDSAEINDPGIVNMPVAPRLTVPPPIVAPSGREITEAEFDNRPPPITRYNAADDFSGTTAVGVIPLLPEVREAIREDRLDAELLPNTLRRNLPADKPEKTTAEWLGESSENGGSDTPPPPVLTPPPISSVPRDGADLTYTPDVTATTTALPGLQPIRVIGQKYNPDRPDMLVSQPPRVIDSVELSAPVSTPLVAAAPTETINLPTMPNSETSLSTDSSVSTLPVASQTIAPPTLAPPTLEPPALSFTPPPATTPTPINLAPATTPAMDLASTIEVPTIAPTIPPPASMTIASGSNDVSPASVSGINWNPAATVTTESASAVPDLSVPVIPPPDFTASIPPPTTINRIDNTPATVTAPPVDTSVTDSTADLIATIKNISSQYSSSGAAASAAALSGSDLQTEVVLLIDNDSPPYTRSKAAYTTALAENPRNSNALTLQAQVQLKENQLDAALNNAQQAVLSDPQNASAFRVLGDAWYDKVRQLNRSMTDNSQENERQQALSNAEQSYKQVLDLKASGQNDIKLANTGLGNVAFIRGQVLRQDPANNFNRALQYYQTSHNIRPRRFIEAMQIGRIYYFLKDFDQSESFLTEAIELHQPMIGTREQPPPWEIFWMLARINNSKQNLTKELDYMQKVIDANPPVIGKDDYAALAKARIQEIKTVLADHR